MSIKLYTLRELEDLTVKWSETRGIIKNGKATTQALKLVSEFGELCKHLHSDEIEKCKDDIGDQAVVLTNLSRLIGAESLEVCLPNFDDRREGILALGDYIGQLCDNIIKNETEKAKTNIGNCMYQLIFLASAICKTDLDVCWSMAYNEIKDRQGFLTPEGNFIKDTDPAYKDYVTPSKEVERLTIVKFNTIANYDYTLQVLLSNGAMKEYRDIRAVPENLGTFIGSTIEEFESITRLS